MTACGSSASSSTAASAADETPASQTSTALSDESADIVIIGGGAAGITAALKAAEADVDIILLEKQGVLGGASAMASSGINAGGSSLQMETLYRG